MIMPPSRTVDVDTHSDVFHVRVHMWFSGAHGTYSTAARDTSGPSAAQLAYRASDKGACRRYRSASRHLDLRARRRAGSSRRFDEPGHPRLDARTSEEWGVAYRYGIKRRTPRRSEGSWCQWFRSDLFGDAQSELVLKKPGLAAGALVYVTRDATRGLVTPTCAVEEVASS